LRKNLNAWRFNFEGEDAGPALARFLIAFDELRARLAPSKYPNIEVSDEGHLWFNIDSLVGVVEVLAFPFGFDGVEAPFFAVSLPRKAEDVDLGLLNRLMKIAGDNEAQLFADQKTATVEEILSAYSRNEHPPLNFTSDFDENPQRERQKSLLQLPRRALLGCSQDRFRDRSQDKEYYSTS